MKKDITKKTKSPATKDYVKVLLEIKKHIREAQIKASLSVNKELLSLYFNIGQTINRQQKKDGWGSKIVEKLIEDIQKEFPGIEGFSRINVFRMLAFFNAYEIVSQAVTQITDLPVFNIPWGHNVVLLSKVKKIDQRLWYAQKSIEFGWSRSMLETCIESDLYNRQGKAITNFKKTLPSTDSDMAQQALKDPYNFDFLMLSSEMQEREVEQGLIDHIQKFLLELGQGFSFIGRQYHLVVGDQDIYLDMLFYHIKLRCFIVVELKATKFDARDIGQLNLYLSAVDNLLKHPQDTPTIGLLLCKFKNNIVAEYALQGITKPIGVASYTTELVSSLPKEFKGKLPTIAEIEEEFEKSKLMIKKIKAKKKTTKKKN